jgi:hypothetical protein
LADSDDVLPGVRIHALGFPGIAFNPNLMDASAEFKSSSENGEIGQIKAIRHALPDGHWEMWDAFEMSAEINHGSSGGPVVDGRGRAVAINVAGNIANAPGHMYSVPINVAKELLKKAHIEPDPGPLSRSWAEALDLFSRGHYAEAKKKFEEVHDTQRKSGLGSFSLGESPAGWDGSPCVTDMIKRCNRKLATPDTHPTP